MRKLFTEQLDALRPILAELERSPGDVELLTKAARETARLYNQLEKLGKELLVIRAGALLAQAQAGRRSRLPHRATALRR